MKIKIFKPEKYSLRFLLIILAFLLQSGSSPGVSSPGKVYSWVYIYHGAPLSQSSLQRDIRKYDFAALTGFALTGQGNLIIRGKPYIQKIIARCRRQNVTWYPVVTFTSAAAGKKLLLQRTAVKNAVNNLAKMVRQYNCMGLHLDFEYLPPRYAMNLKAFLIELRNKTGQKKISMALFPQVGFPAKWAKFHRLRYIAPHLDEAVIMCYDYHRAGSRAGPVTSPPWAEKNIQHFLRYFTPRQLWLGVPAYGYIWPEKGRGKVITAAYLERCRRCTVSRHSPSQNLHVSRYHRGARHEGYLADHITRKSLRNLARKYKLKGTALWRLGLEERNR